MTRLAFSRPASVLRASPRAPRTTPIISAARVRDLFQGAGIFLTPDAAKSVARRVNKDGIPTDRTFQVDGYQIHCLNADLPEPHSLDRILLFNGLLRCRNVFTNGTIDMTVAARKIFKFQDREDAVAEDILRDQMNVCGITVSHDYRHVYASFHPVEEGFIIRRTKTGADGTDDAFDFFHFKALIIKELYQGFHCDIHRLAKFLGGTPLVRVREILKEVKISTEISGDFKAYDLPPTFAEDVPAGAERVELRTFIQQAMADIHTIAKARLNAEIANDRVFYDDMYRRLRLVVNTDLPGVVSEEDRKEVADHAWAFLNIQMHKLNMGNLMTIKVKPEQVLLDAVQHRVGLLPHLTPVYLSKNRRAGARLSDTPSWATGGTLNALFFHLRQAAILTAPAFSNDERKLFETPEVSMNLSAQRRDLARRLYIAFDKEVTVDHTAVQTRVAARFPDTIIHSDPKLINLRNDVENLANSLDVLINDTSIEFYGIQQERQHVFRAALQSARETCRAFLAATDPTAAPSLDKGAVVQGYGVCVRAIENLIARYKLLRKHQSSPRSLEGLYYKAYAIRPEPVANATLIGAIPRTLRPQQTLLASVFVPNIPELWAKIPGVHRAYLVSYAEDTLHFEHMFMPLQIFHLHVWPAILKQFPDDMPAAEKNRLKEAYIKSMACLRMKVVPDPLTKKPLVAFLDAAANISNQIGGAVILPDGRSMLMTARQVTHDLTGIDPRQMVDIPSKEEIKGDPAAFMKDIQRRFAPA